MSDSMRGRVAVIGAGVCKFGERVEADYSDLALEAFDEALTDATIEPEQIDAAWLGTYTPAYGWGVSGASLADALRLYGRPVVRVENYCATGMEALRGAAYAVAAGQCDIALALGVEKLKDRPARGLPRVGQHPVLAYGNSAPGLFALAANRYMHTFGIDRTPLAHVAVKNHANGARNAKAHMQREITIEQALNAPIIAEPFGLFDCCPVTDGAAAVIVCRPEIARELSSAEPVWIHGIGSSGTSARPQWEPGYDYVGFRATRQASLRAYEQAGINDPGNEIDVAEVHDCFTWTEITNYEDLGFAEKGSGWKLAVDGVTALDGDLPVNPSGGLKSFGHPIGASGLRMVAEITNQLRGRCGDRQVAGARRGLAHNVGGPGAVSCVTILGQEP
ncbi:MAG: acetyl-CoA acetyltransferase [Candidatus Dadabacteria bacterium]|nr:MAG: acetyl-CoA acetyltransferase [Candidatus Dadabacteria bacterium]